MALDPIEPSVLDFILQVERLYASLMAVANSALDSEHGLGGKLIYAGDLNATGRALLIAANIAGAASLAVSADQARQKQAVKDGVIDFLVTSLSEALRILKNQVRKRETVAVCVAAPPEVVEREMHDRGLLPDLIASGLPGASVSSISFANGAHTIKLVSEEASQALLTWQVAGSPATSMPVLDAIVLDCLGRDPARNSSAGARWLRLSPRYLGRLAQGFRILHCDPDIAKEFVARAQRAVTHREISVQVRFDYRHNDEDFIPHLIPPAVPEGSA